MNWVPRLLYYALTFVLHPLFTIIILWLIFYSFNPYAFGGNEWNNETFITLSIRLFAGSTFLPALAIFLIRRLGLIENLNMVGIKERIVPLTITCLFYFWIFLNVRENGNFPPYFQQVILGICMTLLFSFFTAIFAGINLFAASSISLLLAFIVADLGSHRQFFFINGQALLESYWVILGLVLAIGFYLSYRLFLGRSSPRETLAGITVGIGGQLLATFVM